MSDGIEFKVMFYILATVVVSLELGVLKKIWGEILGRVLFNVLGFEDLEVFNRRIIYLPV